MEIYLIAGSITNLIRRLRLSLTELPGFVRRYGFEGIEISDRLIGGSDDAALADFAALCERMRLGVVLDIGCDLTLSSERLLADQVEYAKTMTRTAKALGARGMRIWLGGQMLSIQNILFGSKKRAPSPKVPGNLGSGLLTFAKKLLSSGLVTGIAHVFRKNMPSRVFNLEGKMRRAVISLKQIVEDQEAEGLFFAVENHWGISAQPETLLSVIDAVGFLRLGTCPDFANFPKDVNRYEGLRRLVPRAFLAHTKLKTGGSSEEREVDFHRCLAILKESAFDGILAVEHDGPGDGLSRCLTMQRLIRDFW
ncbi:MAG: hypothetical protein COX20_05850 [Desulfobacterales bacterium CG23_combo_of_CG06-09_8_20_14_all_52_9]|nr:MAG: hypothetical protein COX20_05850 [Desulfobacterales bacterium CG23_combo_of_CG06-09_8_20_14_all_52_9]